MLSKAKIELPAGAAFQGAAVDFVVSFARRLGCGPEQQARLEAAVSSALAAVMQNNAGGKSDDPVALEVSEGAGKVVVEVVNRGVPLLLNQGQRSELNVAYFSQIREASKHADKVSLENFGRRGQVLTLELGLGPQAAARSTPSAAAAPALDIPQDETITVRLLQPGEEEALSRLFYLVYGYQYVNELVYYPEKIKATDMLAYYAEQLPTVEINSSYYAMPRPEMLEKWALKTPAEFRFSIKAPKAITHDGRLKADTVAETLGRFYEVLQALGDKRGPVLFQLPPSMKKDFSPEGVVALSSP